VALLGAQPLGYGVIGNTKVSGSFVLGSSPGIPAKICKNPRISGVFALSLDGFARFQVSESAAV
ncbi:MAG: hypothetical protein RLZZ471_674, partial [Actinomycetota bacterium]